MKKESMPPTREFSAAVKACVWAVIGAGALGYALLGGPSVPADGLQFLIVLALSALIGVHSVRYTSQSMELSSSHPFLIYSIVAFGPRPAVWIIVVGMLTTLLAPKTRPAPIRVAFNIATIVLSTVIAGAVFGGLGGVTGGSIEQVLVPLLGAAIAYLVANSALIALVVSIDRPEVKFLKSCADSLVWGGIAYLTGYAIGIAGLYATDALGQLAIVLILPPCWLLLSFYRMHESRLETERLRTTEVEALNQELSKSVGELRDALRHIKQLRGLLPICMHCKSIRDDKDVWHRIEAYIGEHSDASLTHALCGTCRARHYPEIDRKLKQRV